MNIRVFLEGIKNFFTRKRTGQGGHTGLLYGGIVFLVSMLLMLAGFLNNIDTALNAIVFQLGYKPPKEPTRELLVIKKDEVTSSLIGKNPDRRNLPLFRLLGQPQAVSGRLADKDVSLDLLRIHFGFFQGLKELPISLSYCDWDVFQPASLSLDASRGSIANTA